VDFHSEEVPILGPSVVRFWTTTLNFNQIDEGITGTYTCVLMRDRDKESMDNLDLRSTELYIYGDNGLYLLTLPINEVKYANM